MKWSWLILSCFTENTRNPAQNIRLPCEDSNPALTEYEAGVFTSFPSCSAQGWFSGETVKWPSAVLTGIFMVFLSSFIRMLGLYHHDRDVSFCVTRTWPSSWSGVRVDLLIAPTSHHLQHISLSLPMGASISNVDSYLHPVLVVRSSDSEKITNPQGTNHKKQTVYKNVKFQVLTAALMEVAYLWDVAQGNLQGATFQKTHESLCGQHRTLSQGR